MTDTTKNIDQSTPNQIRRYYGLWMFFALVLLLAAICLLVVVRYQRQIALIERIEQSGGMIDTTPVGPDWLRKFVGEKRMRGLDEVNSIIFILSQGDNELLEKVSILTNLEVLCLNNPHVTDAGLVHLKSLTKLKILSLDGTQVTDAGLVHLQKLTSLERLYLDSPQVTGTGLMHLKGLTHLEVLFLENTQVTGEGVEELQTALPDCEIFWNE